MCIIVNIHLENVKVVKNIFSSKLYQTNTTLSEPFENLMAKLIPLSHQYMTADLPGWVLQIKHFLVLISAMRLGTGYSNTLSLDWYWHLN